jgi:hypothetical protein
MNALTVPLVNVLTADSPPVSGQVGAAHIDVRRVLRRIRSRIVFPARMVRFAAFRRLKGCGGELVIDDEL